MTLLKSAAASIGWKGFWLDGPTATSRLRPGLGTLPLVGGVSQSYEQMYCGQPWLNVVINRQALDQAGASAGTLEAKAGGLEGTFARVSQVASGFLQGSAIQSAPRARAGAHAGRSE